MELRLPAWTRRRAISGMLMLYAGKASGVLVTLLFIPLYSRALGPSQFGVVAVILSLQALLVMLDLGMSTLVGRDIAAAGTGSEDLRRLRRGAELGLGTAYLVALLLGALALGGGLSPAGIPVATLLCCIVLFAFLVLQNLYYCTVLARGEYAAASAIQLVGNLARAAATGFVLTGHAATLTAFVVTQTICAGIHAWATRAYAERLFPLDLPPAAPTAGQRWRDAWQVLKRGRSLALVAAAGAAVMQLDKPIIAIFMSSTATAHYFLAMTLCLVPTSILAGPVAQYFQPLLMAATAQRDAARIRRVGWLFAGALLAVTLPLSAVLWLGRAPLIDLWLGAGPDNAPIAGYVAILLPGIAIGALGYLPYSLLLSAQDFRFQALLSTALTIATLVGAAVAAQAQSVEGICIVYALYHATATVATWLRAIRLPSTRSVAAQAAVTALGVTLMVLLLTLAVGYLLPGHRTL